MAVTLRRSLKITFLAVAALLVIAVIAFFVWCFTGRMEAEPKPLAQVREDAAVTLTEHDDAWVLAPAGDAGDSGLVFLPGAKVDPLAYAATFHSLARSGTTVVIAKVPLRLAIFETRTLDGFSSLAPDATQWAVGGHSLGGVRACQYAAESPDIDLVLLASYCADDLSAASLSALSVAGSEDGLSTPDKITAARHLLPSSADMVTVAGANHAAFGAYGPQAGDGTATIPPAQSRVEIDEALTSFFDRD